MVVLSVACPQPQFVSDEAHGPAGRVVRQLSGGGPDSSTEVSGQEDISLYSYSPEELARKQRIEPAFRWLVGFLESGNCASGYSAYSVWARRKVLLFGAVAV